MLVAALAAAAPLGAAVIDPFESLSGWSTFADTGSTVTLSAVTGVAGNALQMNYDMTAGSFVGITRTYSSRNYAATGANALRFAYRASGPTNTAQIEFVDADSTTTVLADGLVYKFPVTPDNTWRELTVPLTDFITFANGNSSFDLSQTAKFSFGVTKDNGSAGTGTVYFDAFHLIRATQPVSLIDGSENSIPGCVANSVLNTCVNDRIGPQSIIYFQSAGSGYSAVVSTVTMKGAKTRELKCTLGGGQFCGVAEELGGMSLRGNESIRFYAGSNFGGSSVKMEVKDVASVTFSTTVTGLPAPPANFSTYTFSAAAIQAAQPAIDLSALKEIVFVFDTAGAHDLYFDDLSIVPPAATLADLSVVEDFGSDLAEGNFVTAAPTQATVGLSYVDDPTSLGAGADNRVAKLDYSFAVDPSTPFAVAERTLGINLLAEPGLRFRFKGTGGNENLEVKITDGDGTIYVKKLTEVTDTGGVWKTATLKSDQFSFSTLGSDARLDLKNITKVDFAVSLGKAAAGTLALDNLESLPATDFQKTSIGRVLTQVTTPNNPFSPNGDGIKDSFRLTYTLSQTAHVVLRFYALHGALIKTFDVGDQTAGDHAIDWDGTADDGRRVGNGLCLFSLEADGAIDGKDTFKEIAGVLR